MSAGLSRRPRILLSGVGPVSKLGFGAEEFHEGLSLQSAGRIAEPGAEERMQPGLVPPFDVAEFLDTAEPHGNPLACCALAAGALALEDAAVLEDEMDAARCGLAVASALGDPEGGPLRVHAAADGYVEVAVPGEGTPTGLSLPANVLAAELNLDGYKWNLCGDALCGAQAIEAAWNALASERADLMLAGGADMPGAPTLTQMLKDSATGTPLAQGAAMLTLETDGALERREGYALCELGAIVCRSTDQQRSAGKLADLLRGAIEDAISAAGIWQGDVGAVFTCTGGVFFPAAADAERLALSAFSQVPTLTAKRFVGETFAAGFPMECVVAAEALYTGELPPRLVRVGRRRGVEFWVRREREGLLGFAALVVGCSADLVAAAVLMSV